MEILEANLHGSGRASSGSRIHKPVFVIRAMDRHVAIGTGLFRTRSVSGVGLLVVERRRRQMTLKANGVYVRQNQKLWILASVRRMAGCATHLLDHAMFIDPRAGQIGMALEARRYLLLDCALQLLLKNGMGIVARSTLHRTVVDLVVNWRGELSLDAAMTPIAKRGLRGFQQLPFLTGVD